ncbi:MAG: helix-turn-helix transcriptional regulator [Promethearchaeota archaeon]
MSTNKVQETWSSLERRSYSIPILELLAEQGDQVTFGSIMERLKISKRGLFLTLIDLEKDGLITRSKLGRSTYVAITTKGKNILIKQATHEKNAEGLVEQIVRETLVQLEKEGIITAEWSDKDYQEFIKKLQVSVATQLRSNASKE